MADQTEPSAFQEAQMDHVAKIVYKKMVEEIGEALKIADTLVTAASEQQQVHSIAALALALSLQGIARKAAENMMAFGLGKEST